MKNEIKHTAHSTYRCEYHIVFAPKYRRKEIYGQLKDNTKTLQREESGDNRSRGMCRPYTYVDKCATIFKYSTVYGISQGKKHVNDL